MSSTFSSRLIAWQLACGRRNLPWQHFHEPYERLVSEVMLQQTRVDTVIPYFIRFIERFPTAASLAAASQDEVFSLWAGLGYYSRAANLQKAVRMFENEMDGRFPTTAVELARLPGVGPSTAAAVAAFTSGEARLPMVDGNAKRVLARVFLVPGRIGERAFETALHDRAKAELPDSAGIASYTQGLMDLGAAICRRSDPDCARCPMADICRAKLEDKVADYPGRKAPPARRALLIAMSVFYSTDGVWLRKREASTWKGLWVPHLEACGISGSKENGECSNGLPTASPAEIARTFSSRIRAFAQASERLLEASGIRIRQTDAPPVFKHDLTHRRLYVAPRLLRLAPDAAPAGFEFFPWTNLPGVPKPAADMLMLAEELAREARNCRQPTLSAGERASRARALRNR